jgi:hypothetical protein
LEGNVVNTPRLYADFQNLDDFNRIRLTCAGTLADLSRQQITLREGMTVTLYTDDADDAGLPDELLADGVVRYHAEEKCWVAEVDWSALRHGSDDKSAMGVNGAGNVPFSEGKVTGPS